MPKTWTAQAVRGINHCRFIANAQDTLIGLEMSGEVSDGESWRGLALELWPDLTAAQKTQIQALYAKLKAAYEQRILV